MKSLATNHELVVAENVELSDFMKRFANASRDYFEDEMYGVMMAWQKEAAKILGIEFDEEKTS